MKFVLFTDSAANLPGRLIAKYNIRVIPFVFDLDGSEYHCPISLESFDYHDYYQKLANKSVVKTYLINMQKFIDAFEPVLKEGRDVLYVGLSGGISGTYNAAENAARCLEADYPDRTIITVNSLAASMGEGLIAIEAANLREENIELSEIAEILKERISNVSQLFTVDDLMFLKRGGRVSGATAAIGTVLQIKPLLMATKEGKIEAYGKARGRKSHWISLRKNVLMRFAIPKIKPSQLPTPIVRRTQNI